MKTKKPRARTTVISNLPKPLRAAGAVTLWIPVQLVSEMNMREHRWARIARKQKQQASACAELYRARIFLPSPPVKITLTRYGPREMDGDNNVSSCKHLRDQIAKSMGFDDGDRASVEWVYGQEKAKWYAVRVDIRHAHAGGKGEG